MKYAKELMKTKAIVSIKLMLTNHKSHNKEYKSEFNDVFITHPLKGLNLRIRNIIDVFQYVYKYNTREQVKTKVNVILCSIKGSTIKNHEINFYCFLHCHIHSANVLELFWIICVVNCISTYIVVYFCNFQ